MNVKDWIFAALVLVICVFFLSTRADPQDCADYCSGKDWLTIAVHTDMPDGPKAGSKICYCGSEKKE